MWCNKAIWGVVCAAVALTLVAGPSGAEAQSQPPVTTPRPRGLLPPPAGVSTRLELAGPKRIVAGSTRKGTLVVTNRSGAPIDLTVHTPGGCTPKFAVVLGNSDHPASAAFTAECGIEPFLLSPGTNRFPFTLWSSVQGCSDTVQPGLPRCVNGAPPPLPRGKYRAVLFGSDLALPAPRPLEVTLVR